MYVLMALFLPLLLAYQNKTHAMLTFFFEPYSKSRSKHELDIFIKAHQEDMQR